MEAAPGFEPGIRDLQSHALPLGYAAAFFQHIKIKEYALFAAYHVILVRILP